MSLHSDIFSWFQANKSLFFLLTAACLADKQQIPILQFLVWPDLTPQSIALKASMIITPPMWYIYLDTSITELIYNL
jgi:hypothetical protein